MARKKTTGPTDRELAILGVLWERGPSTVREVHEVLHPDAETGYTTTLKLMQIMVEKGLLVRENEGRKHGEGVPPLRREAILAAPHQPATRATSKEQRQGVPNAASCVGEPQDALATRRGHIYRPALSEENTQRQLVQDLLEKVFAGSAEKLVLRALAARKVSPKELQRIREMLDEIEGA